MLAGVWLHMFWFVLVGFILFQTFHKGREWDYVFDVDVADGAPMLKLCMNNGDNPHLVAERFLIENRLPTNYLDQVLW